MWTQKIRKNLKSSERKKKKGKRTCVKSNKHCDNLFLSGLCRRDGGGDEGFKPKNPLLCAEREREREREQFRNVIYDTCFVCLLLKIGLDFGEKSFCPT